MQTKEITSYSFFEFCRDAQEAVLHGYKFDFDSNERYPQMFGSMLTAIMVKEEKSDKVPAGKLVGEAEDFVQPTEQVQEKPVVKQGRKPRG